LQTAHAILKMVATGFAAAFLLVQILFVKFNLCLSS
jgi:hypothetical protein